MSRSSRRRAPRPLRQRLLTGLVALVAVVVVVGLVVAALALVPGGDDDATPRADAPEPTPSATGTPVGEVDTRVVAVARASFCEGVDDAALVRVLRLEAGGSGGSGGSDTPSDAADVLAEVRAEAWENGQKARLEPGLEDVAHEYGCAWSVREGLSARAWVFAPPVTRARAEELARTADDADGCQAVDDAPTYGAATVATVCTRDGQRTRRYAGLFGEAWLTCEVGEPVGRTSTGSDSLAARASTWCSAVLTAATTPL